MEIAWLEDFLAVLEYGSFSRAAEARNVTQPAFSRRIRALEEWIGTPLIHRTTHSVKLTPAGETFRMTAEDILRHLEAGRSEALEQALGPSELLRFASTNALSLGFFPAWLRQVESTLPFNMNIQVVANHMEACERMMIKGQSQFLLCHQLPHGTTPLHSARFQSVQIGTDFMMPISAPASAGNTEPSFPLPGSSKQLVPYLSYRQESGMGRIVAKALETALPKAWLKPIFASHLAKLLVTMAIEGRGMGWSPKSLVDEYVEKGDLVRAGDSSWDIPIEIHLFRSCERLSSAAEQFWSHIISRSEPCERQA
jgi:DNA-binding transcriptional LysR family regulator